MILTRVPLVVRLFNVPGHDDMPFLGTAINRYVYCLANKPELGNSTSFQNQCDLDALKDYLDDQLGFFEAGEIAKYAAQKHLERQWHTNNDLVYETNWTAAACGGTVFVERKQESSIVRHHHCSPRPLFDHLLLFQLKDASPTVHVTEKHNPRAKIALRIHAETASACIAVGHFPHLGQHMDLSMRAMASLGIELTPAASRIYAAARLAGAYGGHFDGKFLALIADPSKHSKIIDTIRPDSDQIKVSFDLAGCSVIASSAVV